jgi:hypothetical protein
MSLVGGKGWLREAAAATGACCAPAMRSKNVMCEFIGRLSGHQGVTPFCAQNLHAHAHVKSWKSAVGVHAPARVPVAVGGVVLVGCAVPSNHMPYIWPVHRRCLVPGIGKAVCSPQIGLPEYIGVPDYIVTNLTLLLMLLWAS